MRIQETIAWIDRNMLMIMAMAVSLASSGIDGAYMSKMMTDPLWFTGYILNTVADIATFQLANWYGRLEQRGTGAHEWQIRRVLYGEYTAIAYSWLFSWRQLRPVLRAIEMPPNGIPLFSGVNWWGIDWARVEFEVVTAILAGFVPVVNYHLAYAQALRDGKFDTKTTPSKRQRPASDTVQSGDDTTPEPKRAPEPIRKQQFLELVSGANGDAPTDADAVLAWLQRNGYDTKSASTRRRWASAVEAMKSGESK